MMEPHMKISKTNDIYLLYLQATRFHRCQTLGFKNGLPVRNRPETGIGGERLVQDLLIEGHNRGQNEEQETTPKK